MTTKPLAHDFWGTFETQPMVKFVIRVYRLQGSANFLNSVKTLWLTYHFCRVKLSVRVLFIGKSLLGRLRLWVWRPSTHVAGLVYPDFSWDPMKQHSWCYLFPLIYWGSFLCPQLSCLFFVSLGFLWISALLYNPDPIHLSWRLHGLSHADMGYVVQAISCSLHLLFCG